MGSTVNFQVVGPLYHKLEATMNEHRALGWTLLIAGVTTLVSTFGAMVWSIYSIFM